MIVNADISFHVQDFGPPFERSHREWSTGSLVRRDEVQQLTYEADDMCELVPSGPKEI